MKNMIKKASSSQRNCWYGGEDKRTAACQLQNDFRRQVENTLYYKIDHLL